MNTVGERAAAEKIDRGYHGRVLQQTLLAPDIVEAILDGRQPQGSTLPARCRFQGNGAPTRGSDGGGSALPEPTTAAAGTRPPGAQSTVAPEMRTSSATLGSSAAKKAANSPGVLPTGS